MMTRFLVAVFFIAIASAADALAECAWVLWTKEESRIVSGVGKFDRSTTWEVASAWPTHRQCLVASDTSYDGLSRNVIEGEGIKLVPQIGVFRSFEGGGYWNTKLYCLPDTIDPRKG
jgi:hypothetical protein